MKIRQATENDLETMAELDREAYGSYGSSKEYFAEKLKFFPKGAIVVEDKGKIISFMIFEILNKDERPESFSDMKLTEPMSGKWLFNIVFTTATNYKDKISDSKLLLAAEKIAKREGCTAACVPLSKDHPYEKNGVFVFYEMNGYKRIGKIKWIPNSNEFVECYFYKKSLL